MAGEDFLVQHFEVTLASGVQSQDHAIPIAIDPDHTRVMMSSWNSAATPVVLQAGSGIADTAVHLVDEDTVRVLGDDVALYDRTVRFTLLSYVGAPGGPNEFTVYRLAFATTTWLSFKRTFAQAGIPESAYAKGTVAVQGFPNGGGYPWVGLYDQNLGGLKIDDYTIGFENNTITMDPYVCRLELIDWNGSNWTVERHNTASGREFFLGGDYSTSSGYLDGSTPINDIGDWSNAWIEGYSGGQWRMLLHPAPTTDAVEVGRITSSIPPGLDNRYSFYVIHNPEIHVEHYGFDLGNSTFRWQTGIAGDFPLPVGHNITLDPSKVFAAPFGYSSRVSAVYPLSEQNVLNTGELAYTYAYVDGVGVRIYRGSDVLEPDDNEMREHIQVIQMAPSGVIPDTSLPGNVIDRPKIDLTFRSQ